VSLHTRSNHLATALLAASCGLPLLSAPAGAAPVFTVSFDDPSGTFSSYYAQISAHVMAAGGKWSSFFGGQPVSIDLLVRFNPLLPTITGNSATSSFVTTSGPFDVFQEGAAAELRTGIDPNGSAADGIITIGTAYLVNELWFDPNPVARMAPVPVGLTDAQSAFIHELGHVLGFSGFLNQVNGQPPANNDISAFDQYVTFNGSDLFFNGPRAVAIYGGPVPLTSGNYIHVGNNSPRPGSDLIPDLMNGIVFFRGTRYYISTLDVAILADTGVPALDTDGDGVLNPFDNCATTINPTQLDADQDGYGNICDADLNNSGTVTTGDFGLLRSVLNQAAGSSAIAAAADLNGSGTVTTADFAILRPRLNTPPGPSGLACAGTVPCP
jgi:hypothetical protein